MIVKHDHVGQKFSLFIENREEAILAYTQMPGSIDLHHMLVPDDMQGSLEELLIQAAISYAATSGIKIIASDEAVRKYFSSHRDYDYLLEE